MRLLLLLSLTASLTAMSQTQIRVGVSTDKPIYDYGDTIFVTVTAYNLTADTVVLLFGTSCEHSYYMDNFRVWNCIVCLTEPTIREIPPHQSFQWWPLRYPFRGCGRPPLAAGVHVLRGEVLGYGLSDTLLVTVLPATSVSDEASGQGRFDLGSNFPNPFNPSTTIEYTLPQSGYVTLRVYNVLGEEVATLVDGERGAGSFKTTWDASGLPSGVYFYYLATGEYTQSKKMLFIQ